MQKNFLALHQLFEQQVKLTPNNVAVVDSHPQPFAVNEKQYLDDSYSYTKLNQLANQLAHLLQNRGVGKESVVAIALDKSVYVVAAMLACSKLGAVFLLLDDQFPTERINFIVQDVQAQLLIAESTLFARIAVTATQLSLDEIKSKLENYSKQNLEVEVKAEDPAYIIYTSGTTGKPKGALLEHKGLSNWRDEQLRIFNLTQKDKILQFAPLSFDPVIWDMLMAFGAGASLYVTPMATCLDPMLLNHYIHKHGITGLTVTPEVMAWLQAEDPCQLKFVVSTGAAFKSQYAKKLLSQGIRLFNGYGPSETTIGVSVQEVFTHDIGRCITVGKAIANTKFYILDTDNKRVQDGEEGEICVAGLLARGYINNPGLTQEKFIANPITEDRDQFPRVYKTGDLGRLRPDGNLEFIGRNDKQIKLNGKRIELEEIQRYLQQHEQVRDVHITTFDDEHSQKKIAAYLVYKQPQLNEQANVNWYEYCKKHLPLYMIPLVFMPVAKLPFNSHGKVDEKMLPKPVKHCKPKQTGMVPLKNDIELKLQAIWLEVLTSISGSEALALDDDFFELGGDSIRLPMLQGKINQQFDVHYPISLLLQHTTLASQASYLADRQSAKVISMKRDRLFVNMDKKERPPKHVRIKSPILLELPEYEQGTPLTKIFDEDTISPISVRDYQRIY